MSIGKVKMKKANKAAAAEWQKEREQILLHGEMLEEQTELLRYAAEKRKSGYPSPEILRSLGKDGVAEKLDEAYALINRAYQMLIKPEIEEVKSFKGKP